MEREICEYMTVEASDPYNLDKYVSECIADGMQPYGDQKIVPIKDGMELVHYQVMVRYV